LAHSALIAHQASKPWAVAALVDRPLSDL